MTNYRIYLMDITTGAKSLMAEVTAGSHEAAVESFCDDNKADPMGANRSGPVSMDVIFNHDLAKKLSDWRPNCDAAGYALGRGLVCYCLETA